MPKHSISVSLDIRSNCLSLMCWFDMVRSSLFYLYIRYVTPWNPLHKWTLQIFKYQSIIIDLNLIHTSNVWWHVVLVYNNFLTAYFFVNKSHLTFKETNAFLILYDVPSEDCNIDDMNFSIQVNKELLVHQKNTSHVQFKFRQMSTWIKFNMPPSKSTDIIFITNQLKIFIAIIKFSSEIYAHNSKMFIFHYLKCVINVRIMANNSNVGTKTSKKCCTHSRCHSFCILHWEFRASTLLSGRNKFQNVFCIICNSYQHVLISWQPFCELNKNIRQIFLLYSRTHFLWIVLYVFQQFWIVFYFSQIQIYGHVMFIFRWIKRFRTDT